MIMEEVNIGLGRCDRCQECDSHQGGVKGIRNVSFMERCNGNV